MSELKPCPFCGEMPLPAEEWGKAEASGENLYYVPCSNPYCGCDGPADLGKSGAIAAWNTRPLEAQLLEACKAALTRMRQLHTATFWLDNKPVFNDSYIEHLTAAIAAAEGD